MTQTRSATGQGEASSTDSALETARLPTIIVSGTGLAEQSLRTTLEALPSVQVLGAAVGCLTALQMVHDRQAGLVVIDANLPLEEVQEFLRLLEQEGRHIRSLVLVATTSQLYRALAAGADAALRRDVSIRELGTAVAGLHRIRAGADAEEENRL